MILEWKYSEHSIYLSSQWLARWLATGEVPGSNPGNGENLLISDERKFN